MKTAIFSWIKNGLLLREMTSVTRKDNFFSNHMIVATEERRISAGCTGRKIVKARDPASRLGYAARGRDLSGSRSPAGNLRVKARKINQCHDNLAGSQ